jgi:hypothetical protein
VTFAFVPEQGLRPVGATAIVLSTERRVREHPCSDVQINRLALCGTQILPVQVRVATEDFAAVCGADFRSRGVGTDSEHIVKVHLDNIRAKPHSSSASRVAVQTPH